MTHRWKQPLGPPPTLVRTIRVSTFLPTILTSTPRSDNGPPGGTELLIMVGHGCQQWWRGLWLAWLHESDLQAPGHKRGSVHVLKIHLCSPDLKCSSYVRKHGGCREVNSNVCPFRAPVETVELHSSTRGGAHKAKGLIALETCVLTKPK